MRLRRFLAIGLVLGLIVLLVAGLVFSQSRRAQDQLEAIRKAGYPVTLTELNDWYQSVPAGENAALKILEACSLLVSPLGAYSGTPEEKALLHGFLTNNQGALNLVHEASGLKKSRYPCDLRQGANTLLPYLSPFKRLVHQLVYATMLHSEEARPERALESYFDALGVCRSLSPEPLLISQLVRVACLALTQPALERLLTDHQLTDPQLEELSNQLRETEAPGQTAMTRAFAGEQCLGFDLFRASPQRASAIFGMGGNTNAMTILFGARNLMGLRHADFAHYRRFMRTWLEVSKLPFPQCLKESKSAAEQFESRMTPVRQFLYPMTTMLFPALGKAMQKEARSCAQLRIAQAAVAIERFRLENHARLPETLNHLTPASFSSLLNDPFDGKALRYRKLDTGYVVYSIGDNGKDDGGTSKLDVTFSVGR